MKTSVGKKEQCRGGGWEKGQKNDDSETRGKKKAFARARKKIQVKVKKIEGVA